MTNPDTSIVDAHVHAPVGARSVPWSEFASTVSGVAGLRVVGVQMQPDMDATLEALGWAANTDAVYALAAYVDVTSPEIEDVLSRVSGSPKFRSVALPVHREDDNHWLVSADVLRGLKAVAAKGLAVDVQIEPRQLPSVGKLAKAVPDLRIVIAHIGSPFIARSEREPWGVYMLNVAPHQNVYAKLSGLPALDTQPWSVPHQRLFVESMVRMFGFERLMFGSDWPEHLGVASYQQVKDSASQSAGPMTAAQEMQLMSSTALAFYGVS